MSDSDHIFREVEEDLRREQLARLWDNYGVHVLIGAAAILLIVGAFSGYRWYLHKQATENGTAFYDATQKVDSNNYAEASDALTKLTKDAPGGYRLLAKLELAAVHAKQGRKADAIALYDEIAGDNGADSILKDFARVQAAALRIDEADQAEIAKRLDKLDADSNPWRFSARELLALSAYRSGNAAESEKLYSRILGDPFAPAEMRKRAENMLAVIVKAPANASAKSDTPADAKAAQKDAATQ
jgi:hypothetical protein